MLTTRFWISAVLLGAMSSTTYSQPARPADPMDPARDPNDPTRIPQVQEPVQTPAQTAYPAYPTDYTPEPEQSAFQRLGLSISAGGGVEGFAQKALRDSTTDGGLWNVRATFGTRSFLAFEAQYLGSAQAVDAFGLDSGAMLVSNGVQGNVRLNFLRDQPVQPFLFAGAAWRRYDITNTARNLSDISDEDDVFEIPVGVGVAYRWRGLLLDARGEYRAATDEDLMPRFDLGGLRDPAPMDRYGVHAAIGYEF